MLKVRKFVVKRAFKDYLPNICDFEIVEETLSALKNGEFLVRAEYISVDPYMRSFANSHRVPYDQFGFQVGKVIESKNPEYLIDTYVVSHSGWRDHVVLNGEEDIMFRMRPYEPDIGDLPLSLCLGALGMPGMTAYLGFLHICAPNTGDVVCISSAAGAVGSLVGQIGKLKGCTVVGFAGTDEKVRMLTEELGFDFAFNYKNVPNTREVLTAIAPNGIDCYFDNVGGDFSAKILHSMKDYGKVAICGSISTYGPQCSKRKRLSAQVSVKMESFSFTQWDWVEQRNAQREIKEWLQSGNIIAKETIINGFDELPKAFISMLSGGNIGKTVVKV